MEQRRIGQDLHDTIGQGGAITTPYADGIHWNVATGNMSGYWRRTETHNLDLVFKFDLLGAKHKLLAGGQRGLGHRRYFDLDIDAVEQRARQTLPIARDCIGRAAAGKARMTMVSARTRIHRGDELEPRREFGASGGPGDRDAPGLHRLAQGLEHPPIELGDFIEEQDATMGQADFTRTRRIAATDQGDGGSSMVRRGEIDAAKALGPELAGDAEHGRRFEGRGFVERRQQGDQAPCKHRFAGAGRADHQDPMRAGGRDFQRTFGLLLAFDIGEVRHRHGLGDDLGWNCRCECLPFL